MRGMRIPGHRTASLARRLGLDRNPLRRGTDRVEAWIRIALVLAFLIGAPLAFGGAERWAGSVAPTAAHAQQAGERRVTATVLQGAPSGSDSFTVVSLSWVKARWAVPGGAVRTGYVEAPAGSRAGSTVPVWLDGSGTPTEPPWPRDQARSWTFMIAVLAPILLALLLLAVMGLFGHVLHRRRLAGWEHAWSAVGPQWTRRPR
jgi:hypothetical protein